VDYTLGLVVLTSLFSFVLALLLTPLFKKIAQRLQIFDSPTQAHKTHIEPIPYLGGASIISSISVIAILSLTFAPSLLSNNKTPLLVLAMPVLMGIVGLVDDIATISASKRFVVQSTAAILVAVYFIRNGLLGDPSINSFFDFILMVLWIVGITNSINLIDNLDGGAGGVVVISSFFLSILAILGNQRFIASISLILCCSTLGFLVWNLHPARIYLGDSGALFLGSSLSILIIRFDTNATSTFTSWFIAFGLMAIPILDTSVVVISRIRNGISPFTGGKDHLSHRLIYSGLSKRNTAIIIWILNTYFCLLGLLLNNATFLNPEFVVSLIAISWITLLWLFLRVADLEVY